MTIFFFTFLIGFRSLSDSTLKISTHVSPPAPKGIFEDSGGYLAGTKEKD
jgi:hypothetical protein